MKSKSLYNIRLHNIKSNFRNIRYTLLLLIVFTSGISTQSSAQENLYKKSPWWIGVSAGTNTNLYHGSTNFVNADLSISATYQNTREIGLFAFPVIEYRKPGSMIGFSLSTGYESRRGSFNETFTTKLAYITFEPSIRMNLLKTPFYLFSGPRIAFNADKRYTYTPDANAGIPSGGVFSDMKTPVISVQIGAAYDFLLTSSEKNNQVIMSPFFSFHPYFGQNPRTIESWNLTTIRTGISFKFGKSRKITMPEPVELPVVIAAESEGKFLISDSRNIPKVPSKTELFSLQEYVFYNLNPSELSGDPNTEKSRQNRYAVKNSTHEPLHLSDPISREAVTQNNLLSQIGEKMGKASGSTITLTGMSTDGVKDGIKLANSLKTFLTSVYQIDAFRVQVKGRKSLEMKVQNKSRVNQIAIIQERGRKVLIATNSKNLQKEFNGNTGNILKPLAVNNVEEAGLYGTVTFKTEGTDEPFVSWSAVLTDDLGNQQNFGPYSNEVVCISAKSILGKRIFGKFDVAMTGKLKNGEQVRKETTVTLVHWEPEANEHIDRYKILYEYNNSKAIHISRQYITDVITPKIPPGSTVVIHGHSESLNGTVFSPTMYLIEVNDTRTIIENSLAKSGRSDVKFVVFGFGKDQIIAPFTKSNPLETFANRSLVIDVISNTKSK